MNGRGLVRRAKTLSVPLLLVFSLLLYFFGVPVARAAEEDEWDTDVSPTALSVTGLDPEVFTGTEAVRIDLELSGVPATSPLAGESWVVETFVQPTPFASMLELDDYLEGDGFPGWRVSVDTLSSPAVQRDFSDSVMTFAVTIPADQMPDLDPHTTGARGLSVRLTSDEVSSETRSVLLFEPYEDAPHTNVHVTVLTPGDGDLSAQQLTDLPGVSFAVQPQFFQGLLEGDEKDPVEDGAQPQATFASQLLASDVELVSLPAEDADLSLLAAASLESLFQFGAATRVSADDLRPEVRAGLEATLIDDVAFASAEGFTQHALKSLRGNLVIGPPWWGIAESADSSVTPTTRTEINAEDGQVTQVSLFEVPDAFLPTEDTPDENPPGRGSAETVTVFDQWTAVHELLNDPSGTPADELLIRQTLRAASLLVGLEDPTDQRTLLAVMDANQGLRGAEVAARLGALLENDWTTPVSFQQVLESPLSTLERETVPSVTAEDSPQLAEYRDLLWPLNEDVAVATSIVASSPSDTRLLSPYSSEVFAATAADLSPAERASLARDARTRLSEFTNTIQVVSVGTVNIVTRATQFPVSIHNSGPAAVTVETYLVPSDPRLQSSTTVEAEVPPKGQVDVTIPVTAVGSGDLSATIVVAAQDGTVLDDSQEIKVRVRANWEDTVTVGVGVVLIVLFLFGIIRTVRKGQRRPQPASAGWVGELS